MNQEKNAGGITELNDSVLEKVSGGYLQVSKWRAYATQNILPALILQRDAADASDQRILDRFYSTIQGTLVSGASVVAPIQNLRSDYYNSSRSTVHSASVRQTLDNAINSLQLPCCQCVARTHRSARRKITKEEMIMMKKAVALFLAAVLLLSCTACSAPAEATETAPTTVPTATEPISAVQAAAVTEPAVEVKPEIDEAELPYDYQTADGLLSITLPNHRWGQVYSDEHDVLLSDGDCAIAVDLYRATDSLPPIPTADKTHKLIFTSAISADEYVLYLIGYASEETDFSDLAAAINSITVDKARITKVWPKEEPTAPAYSVRDTTYTAWVSANALNVRTGSGTENPIITQLTRDTKLTVTGEVLKGNDYIGWSRVRLSNGTEGYVSSQFLTTTQPTPKPTKTGNSKTLYSIHGTIYTVFEYSDYNWRTESGTVFWPATFSTWESASGQVLYDYDPSVPEETQPKLTSQHVLLYNADGSLAQTVYLATDGEWYNASWVNFYPAGNGVWYCGGAVFYDYDPTPEPTAPSPEPTTGPQANWKETFEASLWGHDAMIAVEYTLLYEGTYEVLCQDPKSGATKTVIVDAYTGGWE